MKIRIFAAPAAFLLLLPAWAQQTKGSAVQTATGRAPLKEAKPADFWDGDDPNVVHLMTHPFANKAYIQQQTRPIHDRLNELDALTSENGRSIKDVDTRSQRAIQLASEKSIVADLHATDALNRSLLAKTAAMDASTKVSAAEQKVGTLGQYKGSGVETELRFRSGQSALSKNAKQALDTMAAPLKAQKGYIIEIRGFAPGRGRAANANAKKMSDSVVRYLLLTHKIPMYRISVLNMGTGKAAKSRRTGGGRVDISVLQNATVDTAQR